jgi:hypothetical protein
LVERDIMVPHRLRYLVALSVCSMMMLSSCQSSCSNRNITKTTTSDHYGFTSPQLVENTTGSRAYENVPRFTDEDGKMWLVLDDYPVDDFNDASQPLLPTSSNPSENAYEIEIGTTIRASVSYLSTDQTTVTCEIDPSGNVYHNIRSDGKIYTLKRYLSGRVDLLDTKEIKQYPVLPMPDNNNVSLVSGIYTIRVVGSTVQVPEEYTTIGPETLGVYFKTDNETRTTRMYLDPDASSFQNTQGTIKTVDHNETTRKTEYDITAIGTYQPNDGMVEPPDDFADCSECAGDFELPITETHSIH